MNRSLDKLTAADIMRTEMVSVSLHDSLQEAMAVITENHVTGLPVVDRKGQCVGVITATDILNFEQDHMEDATEANENMARHFDPESQRWEDIRLTAFALEEFADVPVEDVMNRKLVYVAPNASLCKVAEQMVNEEVHRILVIDNNKVLQGIISAADFVRLFAEL